MKRYLVGGAVRDALLGLPVKEQDWVVVGATPEDMAAAGYRPVGKDFPVFLHPQTKEEHALARTERKSGRGYHGFNFHTGPEVSLEDDLIRRDLTVNAMARDEDGKLVDPHGGQRDLEAKVLRHVSAAFAEDPVRILRLARFAARFAPMGFRIADETMDLMRGMVAAGEVDALVAERVWKEAERALSGDGRVNNPLPLREGEGGGATGSATSAQYRPSVFFQVLQDCGALARVMPELAALAGVPQRPEYHPEIDSLVHTLMSVDAATRMGFSLEVRVAALLHDLGKAATPKQEWPRHNMHDQRGLPLVERFAERLRLPNAQKELALAVTRDHLIVHRAAELRPGTLLELLERLRGFQRGSFFDEALNGCLSDARGRLGKEQSEYPPVDYLRAAREEAAKVQAGEVVAAGFSGVAVGEELRRRRTEKLGAWVQTQRSAS